MRYCPACMYPASEAVARGQQGRAMSEPVTPTRPSAPETPAGSGAGRSLREEHPRKGC